MSVKNRGKESEESDSDDVIYGGSKRGKMSSKLMQDVLHAVMDLKEKGGSSIQAIATHIQALAIAATGRRK